MRVYFVQLQITDGTWITGTKRYTSCRRAHSAARRASPSRVLMLMEKPTIKLPAGR